MKTIKILLTTLAVLSLSFNAQAAGKKADAPAKYVFLFIGDGMGHNQTALAESYLSYTTGVYGVPHLEYTKFKNVGFCLNYSASSLVTDSAASGTAISTGVKTTNGYLGVDPDGNPVYSMAKTFKEMGYNIGIYSSVPVNHATPGAFYAHNKSRGDYYNISKDMIPADYNFYGGSNFLNPTKEGEPTTEEYLESNGYKVAFGQAEFDAVKNDCNRVVLLAEPRESGETMLLADMTRNALGFLGDDKPFFIMCEGGEIDYKCHSNLLMPTVEAVLKFNDAIKVALEFYAQHPDETLIVVTADHETGGLALASEKAGYANYWEPMIKQWEESGHKEDALTFEENKSLCEKSGFQWTTHGHSASPVPIYAIGKGAETFCGYINNTDIAPKILKKAK